MRRILFFSLIAIGSGAWARGESSENTYDFLVRLRSAQTGLNAMEKREDLQKEIEALRLRIKEQKNEVRDTGAVKAAEEQIAKLEREKLFYDQLKGSLPASVAKISSTSWKPATSGMAPAGSLQARLQGTPFTIVVTKNEKNEVVSSLVYAPEAVESLGETTAPQKKGVFRDINAEEAKSYVEELNKALAKETKKLKDGEVFDASSATLAGLLGSKGPLAYRGKVDAWVATRAAEIGAKGNVTSELGQAHYDLRVLKDDSALRERDAEDARKLALASKLRAGEIKLGDSDEDLCGVLVKEAGGFGKLPESVRNECKAFAPKEEVKVAAKAKDASEEAEVADAEKKMQARDLEAEARIENLIRRNMAMCESMAQQATQPMGNQQRKTLGEIVQNVMTNPKVVCPTFNLLMSSVAAENFDLQTGQGGQYFDQAIQRELGALDGMEPAAQGEFIGTKAERVVQDYFVTANVKTKVRGNMREGQLALNAKNENERALKLAKEQSCLQKMAASMASLLQLRQSMSPSNEEEAMAVQQIAHYNSIANMLLTSVNREIQMSNLSGSIADDPRDDQPVRRTAVGRGQRNEASSVRVVKPSQRGPAGTFDDRNTTQESQGGTVRPPRPRKPKPQGIYGQ